MAGGLTLAWRFLRLIRSVAKRVDEFMDDWNGIPERPGHEARPGVMSRLNWIEHELKPNSGSSLRDAVNRIESELGTNGNNSA
ncbi:hypothetical protein ACFYP4_02895 [Streptomyces sp. NPDC005551]|uniref:hypothetical protein n=1 Tax=Streptomyces sp. NPDC005551 TaxID=3364725 RepID=UPI0036B0150B